MRLRIQALLSHGFGSYFPSFYVLSNRHAIIHFVMRKYLLAGICFAGLDWHFHPHFQPSGIEIAIARHRSTEPSIHRLFTQVFLPQFSLVNLVVQV